RRCAALAAFGARCRSGADAHVFHLSGGRVARRARSQGSLMPPVLSVEDLSVTFALHQSEVKAVSDLNFQLEAGETLAVVGESGSGKSQAFLSIMGLLARNG